MDNNINEKINEIFRELKNGVKIRVHRDYTSYIIQTIKDKDTILIIYKDWNKYKQRWDYHVDTAYSVCYLIYLYKQMHHGKFGEGKEK